MNNLNVPFLNCPLSSWYAFIPKYLAILHLGNNLHILFKIYFKTIDNVINSCIWKYDPELNKKILVSILKKRNLSFKGVVSLNSINWSYVDSPSNKSNEAKTIAPWKNSRAWGGKLILTSVKSTIYYNALIMPQSSLIDPRINNLVAKLPVDIMLTNSSILLVVYFIFSAIS